MQAENVIREKHAGDIEQLKFIFSDENRIIVTAPAGCGKTTAMVSKIAWELSSGHILSNKKVLAMTFSVNAAMKIKDALKTLLPNLVENVQQYISKVDVANYHNFAMRILFKHGYCLNGEFTHLSEFKIVDEDSPLLNTFITSADSDKLKKVNDAVKASNKEDLIAALDDYWEILKRKLITNHVITYNGILISAIKLLRKTQISSFYKQYYQMIIIDEFQDINRAQYECIKMLSEKHNNVFAVGDDDQSIYGFRGARPEFTKNFLKDYKNCGTVYLDINYRSTEQIIALSRKLISKNKLRFDKNIRGTGRTGAVPSFFFCRDTEEEADRIVKTICVLHNQKGVPYKNIAVIYRNNIASNPFARRFVKQGIPYFLKDNTYDIYDHWIAKDICAYIDFIYDTSDDEAFERIVNKPARRVSRKVIEQAKRFGMSLFYGVMNSEMLGRKGKEELEQLYNDIQTARKLNGRKQAEYIYKYLGYDKYLEDYAAYKKCSSVFLKQIAYEILAVAAETDDIRNLRSLLADYKYQIANAPIPKIGDDAVTLTTMHSAKGLEFGTVFVTSLVETIVPYGNPKIESEVEEERRLFYVAVTRAKERLILSSFASMGYNTDVKLSRFLGDLGIRKKE